MAATPRPVVLQGRPTMFLTLTMRATHAGMTTEGARMGLRPAVTGRLTRPGALRGAEVTTRPAANLFEDLSTGSAGFPRVFSLTSALHRYILVARRALIRFKGRKKMRATATSQAGGGFFAAPSLSPLSSGYWSIHERPRRQATKNDGLPHGSCVNSRTTGYCVRAEVSP